MAQIEPFTYSRTFKAPRSLVYAVHTSAEHIKKWFGPANTVVKKFDMNFFVGGVNHYCIVVPVDIEMWGIQVYREIIPNEKIVHIQSFSDKDGKITTHPMSPTWPKEMLANTRFEDDGEDTKVTITWIPFDADEIENRTFDEARESMTGGFKGMMDNIETYIDQVKMNA